jgi:hypothetical protein
MNVAILIWLNTPRKNGAKDAEYSPSQFPTSASTKSHQNSNQIENHVISRTNQ